MQFNLFDLGLLDYKKAWQFQKVLCESVKNTYKNHALILCRHYPVITMGRQADKGNILVTQDRLKTTGIQIYEIERGGDITYHGPGQITAYPVFNLNYLKKDVHWFLRQLEEAAIGCLADFGAKAKRCAGFTGVWVGGKKIASIGIAIKNWITFHGLSINVKKNDLINFGFIRPCGMNIEMTSLESVLERNIEIENVKERLIHKFREIKVEAEAAPLKDALLLRR